MFAASKTASVSGGYQISRSLRFNSADSAYLNRTPASATNRKTWTWSAWVKRGQITSGQTQTLFSAGSSAVTGWHFLNSSDILELYDYSGGYNWQLNTTQVFRDVSAWYHIVVAFDTTQATASNRLKLYVNGTQVTSFSTANYPALNTDYQVNNNVVSYVGRSGLGTIYDFDGYQTEINLIDGQALTPSSFGETNAQTGVWQPKAYSGSYGTNGFYLNFSDNSNTTAATLGKDYSGNGNNWTPNNFSVTAGAGNDSLVDSPTSYGTDTGVGGTVRGNYCTWNPLGSVLGAGSATNGNLDVACADSSTGTAGARGTIAPTSGKWYFEVLVVSGGVYGMIGVSDANKVITSAGWGSLNAWTYYGNTGYKYGNGTDAAYGATYTTGDLIGVAYDSDAGTLTFYKNGTSQGQAFTGLTGKSLAPYVGTASGTLTFTLNAGQRPFAYTAPSGYKALCTQNLPTPTIGATTATQAGKYFGVTLRTGGAPSGGTYTTTVDMSNGALLWDKARNQAQNNYLVDSNRGLTKFLQSNATTAESTQASWYTSFGNGTYSTGSTDWGSSVSLVDWIWAAGANTTNTAGSITSTVSANTTSGFSVVTWTGNSSNATIGHGLGVAPSMVIIKYRGTTDNWYVYNSNVGTNKYLVLNATDAAATSTSIWQNTAPTSTVFSIGGGNNNSTLVAYCFAEVAGYSKFGSWTGNGSSDGVFVYCGFRPAYVLIKGTNSNGYIWTVYDSKRNTYNVANLFLEPDSSGAEVSFTTLDFVSNGFKIRSSDSAFNASGSNYIFAAFAESPFKYSLAR